MTERKLERGQIEKLAHAMDYIHSVMLELEESGKNKRIYNNLDKAVGFIYDAVEQRSGERK